MTSESLSISEQEYYLTPGLKGVTQQLAHLAFFGDGLSLVMGVAGAGKSALAEVLEAQLAHADDLVRLSFEAEVALAEGVEKIARGLGLLASGSLSVGEILAELRHFAQSLSHDKKLAILIIDNAHYLDDQCIGALVSLMQGRTESNFGLHLILLAKPGLDKRIDALQILDVPVYDFDIPAVSPSELAVLLERKGFSDEIADAAQLQKIWAQSQGVPGLALSQLNVAQNVADDSATNSKSPINLPLGHVAAVVLLVLVLSWSLLGRDGGEDEVSKGVIPVELEASGAADTLTDSVEEIPSMSDAAGDVERAESLVAAQVDIPVSGVAGSDLAPVVVEGEDPLVQQEVALSSSVGSAEVSSSIKLQQATPRPAVEPSPTSVLDDLQPVVVPAETSNNISEDAFIEASEAFILAQNEQHYTLQVIAASRREALEAYLDRQPNRDSLKMYRGTRQGKSWFVIVQGAYSTRAAAADGAKRLPAEQANAGPWPRRFKSIQEEVKDFRGQ